MSGVPGLSPFAFYSQPSPPECTDFRPDIIFPYDASLRVGLPTQSGFISPPSTRSDAPLAPITKNRVNLDRLLELDTGGILLGIIEVIRSKEGFLAQCAVHPDTLPYGAKNSISRNMLKHVPTLRQAEVIEPPSDSIQMCLPQFTVAKSSGGSRLVTNAIKLNECMRPPPPMGLPDIIVAATRIAAADHAILEDFRSWFYQIPLATDVRPFFGMKLAPERGRYSTYWLTALCMGWCWAPTIAHRAASVILPWERGVVWVDNLIVLGNTADEAVSRHADVRRRAAHVGAEFKVEDGAGVPLRRFTVLGIDFNLTLHAYRPSQAWVNAFLVSPELGRFKAGALSARELCVVTGRALRFCHIAGHRLCNMWSTLSCIRRISRLVGSSLLGWDDQVRVSPSVVHEVVEELPAMEINAWVDVPPPLPAIALWCDASQRVWAVVSPDLVVRAPFATVEKPHIFIKEMLAAAAAVLLAARLHPGHRVTLHIDNSGVVACVKVGHSRNHFANQLLRWIFAIADWGRLQLDPQWVPTHVQAADPFTRGAPVSASQARLGAPPLPPPPVVAAFVSSSGVADAALCPRV